MVTYSILNTGVKEINWKNLMACLQSRQIRLTGLKWEDIMTKSARVSEKLNLHLKEWESYVWSLDDLDHVASLMVGQQLAQTAITLKRSKHLDVSVEQLECALELASNMNYSMVVPSKDAVTPNSEIIQEESNNVLDAAKSDTSVSFVR